MSEVTLPELLLDELSVAFWYELRLGHEAQPHLVWELVEEVPGAVLSYHHFTNEPWHPGRFVVRVLLSTDGRNEAVEWLRNRGDVEDVRPWERESEDRALFGDFFLDAMTFFQASSKLAHWDGDPARRRWMTNKLVHCMLNARGMSWWGEVRWALRYAYARLEMIAWWRIRGRREWERTQR